MNVPTEIEVVSCANGLALVFTKDADGYWTLHDVDRDTGTLGLHFTLGSDRLADKLKPRRIANCGGVATVVR